MNDTTFQGSGNVAYVPVIVNDKLKRTNANRIRSMTDEELATLISSDFCEIICSPETDCQYADCRGKILNWLKQEDGCWRYEERKEIDDGGS